MLKVERCMKFRSMLSLIISQMPDERLLEVSWDGAFDLLVQERAGDLPVRAFWLWQPVRV